MTKSRFTSADEQIIGPMIALAGCSKQDRIVVVVVHYPKAREDGEVCGIGRSGRWQRVEHALNTTHMRNRVTGGGRVFTRALAPGSLRFILNERADRE